jgi:hypothetical protein
MINIFKLLRGGEILQTYWEKSVKDYFDNLWEQKTPLTHLAFYQAEEKQKQVKQLDDLIGKPKKKQPKKKSGRPRKKK